MEKSLLTAWVAHKLGGPESQGISRVGQTVLVRLMECQIWHPPGQLCGSVGGWCRKGTMPCPPFCLGAVPQILPWSHILWFLPECHWYLSSWYSDWVILSKCECGFFKRNCLGLEQFLPLTQSPLVFAARSYGDLSSWHWNPGLGGLVWGWDSSFPRFPSQIFIHHTWMWDQPILHLCPSYQSGWMLFL